MQPAPVMEAPSQKEAASATEVDIRSKVMKLSKAEAQLVAITVVDLSDGTFELIYTFFTKSQLVSIRFTVSDRGEMDSISDIFPGATNFEREIIDLFGLRFKGMKGGLLITPESGIVAPLRKSSSPSTPSSRDAKEGKDG